MVTILKNDTIEDWLQGFKVLGKRSYIDLLHTVDEKGSESFFKQKGFKQFLDIEGFFNKFYDEINEILLAILDDGGIIEFEDDFKTYATHLSIERLVPKLIDIYYKEEI